MLNRNQPRGKFNPGAGDFYVAPGKPNLRLIVREAKAGRLYITRADDRGPLTGGLSILAEDWFEDVAAVGMEYFKKAA